MGLKRTLAGSLALLWAFVAISCSCGASASDEETEAEVFPLGFDPSQYTAVADKVKSGETFTTIFTRLGMTSSDAYRLCLACDTTFNARHVVAGTPLDAFYSGDSLSLKLEYVVYNRDKIHCTVFKCADSLMLWNYAKPVQHQRSFADVTISVSLWNDMVESGASPTLIMDLADIYQWSVNLFTLQKGDRFRIIYTQSVCDGACLAIDTVHYCLFTPADGSKEVEAVRFSIPGKGNHYWAGGGESLKRMFLKAPLRYNRISSGFSYHRRHPVTGKVRAHTAVDYAAPKGTPVYSIGDGVVTQCGWDGSGGGNRVRIKHPAGYESCYMHLSGFGKGVRKGSRVNQGQLIGYVGSTGRSTGPHLDFRIWQGGKPVNPLKLNSPASEPLPAKYKEEFEAVASSLKNEMLALQKQ